MSAKYVHLIIASKMKYNLQNLIGENEGHLIITIDGVYKDFDDVEIPETSFDKIIQESDVVFIHFLDSKKAQIVNSLPKEKKVVWFCWGADAYYLGRFDNKFLLEKTKKIRLKLGFKSWKGVKDVIKLVLSEYSDLIPPSRDMIKAMKRADVIVPVVDMDYENLVNYYGFTAPRFQVNYINTVFYDPPKLEPQWNSNNILLGNSASLSNNHIEIIDLISRTINTDQKVFIPLSYGNKDYAEYVTKYAINKLGDTAHILDTRLSLPDYIKMIGSCGSIVMNHTRQQAMGNVILGLWMEKTIFINSRSGMFRHFSEKGFKLYPTEEYSPTKKIGAEELKLNKELLYKWHGPAYLEDRFCSLLEYLNKI